MRARAVRRARWDARDTWSTGEAGAPARLATYRWTDWWVLGVGRVTELMTSAVARSATATSPTTTFGLARPASLMPTRGHRLVPRRGFRARRPGRTPASAGASTVTFGSSPPQNACALRGSSEARAGASESSVGPNGTRSSRGPSQSRGSLTTLSCGDFPLPRCRVFAFDVSTRFADLFSRFESNLSSGGASIHLN
jgi:hypothetical protein